MSQPGNVADDVMVGGIVSDNGCLRFMTECERAVWRAGEHLPDRLVVIVKPTPHPISRGEANVSRSDEREAN